ncbi:protein-S-isoprenylcysteine O-methyltransferase [Hyperolius riggenbachi]|uniref:protein-S-isoprenylcysteine O-methyltransferase n=1 Tax=Hyperolius riggenbachi TaxID=752182 RepID=UPI0035A369CE
MAEERLVEEGRVSVVSFLLGLSVIFLPLLNARFTEFGHSILGSTEGRIVLAVYVALLYGILLLLYRGQLYQVAIRAAFLGFAFGCGLIVSVSQSPWRHFGCYVCSLSFFHYSEYLITAVNNPKSLSLDSFLLNHSLEYTLAAVSSWVEFTIELTIFQELKQITWLSAIGLVMVIFGEALRKSAMLTAGSNFNHIVQNEKSETHTLVTSGVYSWFRHPSYVGWFYWSIGTQVLLCNPICLIGYTLASWRFFRERVEEEEFSLIHFFGNQYIDYKRNVPTGLPFISGVKIEP